MSHFYGTLQGSGGQSTRTGNKSSGVDAIAAGHGGCIHTRIYHDEDSGEDRYIVSLEPWRESGGNGQILANGILKTSKREAS